jgi:hypothetical protein
MTTFVPQTTSANTPTQQVCRRLHHDPIDPMSTPVSLASMLSPNFIYDVVLRQSRTKPAARRYSFMHLLQN